MSEHESKSSSLITTQATLPVLPLPGTVAYPVRGVRTFYVGRESPIKALEKVIKQPEEKQQVVLVTQKQASSSISSLDEVYTVGTIANLLDHAKRLDGLVKITVEVIQRCTLLNLSMSDNYLVSQVEPFVPLDDQAENMTQSKVWAETVLNQFERYLNLGSKTVPIELLSILADEKNPSHLSDIIAMHLSPSLKTSDAQTLTLTIKQQQELLATFDVNHRLEKLSEFLATKIAAIETQKKIYAQVEQKLIQGQRDFILTEQMKAIQAELSDSQSPEKELDKLAQAIKKAKMPKQVHQKAMEEFKKLSSMPPISAETTVSRNYIETLINLPWHRGSKSTYKLSTAEAILGEGHYGLEKVKAHILEFVAVIQRVKKPKGFILCLAGPPGVGKTSLGRSIAAAMNLEFVRISLGGVRDEAEIRGHRRTYIGAMPGQIIQKIGKLKTKNPLIMLDEIDKMAMDFRGDPASALLEVLDPEHNKNFSDHYLEVPFDLSEVFFVATANDVSKIPPPLLDRMEVIHIPGYTEEEKVNIARAYLLPKQAKKNGLSEQELSIDEDAFTDIVRYYTLEAGVRNLERETAKLCRKAIITLDKGPKRSSVQITASDLEGYLGVRRFRYGLARTIDQIGEVNGLAWTAARGELLKIESAIMPGKGKITYTGHLGEVMRESIQNAFNAVRVRAAQLGIAPDFYKTTDIHVHLPEGATPKDGPSAGIGMCTALISSLTNRPVRADVAMTGELTLLGRVLPIGGLKEKLLAAHQGGISLVIIPKDNEKDLKEIPENVRSGLEIHLVESIEEVIKLALREFSIASVPALPNQVTSDSLNSNVTVKH